MGCTSSSAPNTIPANANTADKSIQFEEDMKEKPSTEMDNAGTEDNGTNETKVLPSCDTFEEPVQIVRTNKSTNSLVHENDVPANGHINESETVPNILEKAQNDVSNVTKIELLLNAVFDTNQHLSEKSHIKAESEKPADSNGAVIKENCHESHDTAMIPESNNDSPRLEVEDDGEECEEAEGSPSQSQSSRATRWEALADIAAELPPSMAVDPLTGQIYALTK